MSAARCRRWVSSSSGPGDVFPSISFRVLHTFETEKDEKENLVKECTGVAGKFIGGSIIPLTFSNKLPASKKC